MRLYSNYTMYSLIFSSINGDQWNLSNGAKLHDVTHLPCRSARYQPLNESASPANVNSSEFPVIPGSLMPTYCCRLQKTRLLGSFCNCIRIKNGGIKMNDLLKVVFPYLIIL